MNSLAEKSIDPTDFLDRRGRIVFLCVGLLLAFSATLKLWMVSTDPFAALRTGYPEWLLWVSIFIELGALWVVAFARSNTMKWRVAVSLFLVFLFISLGRHFAGHVGCGCFGQIEVPPLLSAVISIVMLVALLLTARPKRGTDNKRVERVYCGAWPTACGIVVIGIFAGGWAEFGDWAIAKWHGQSRVVAPPADLGPLVYGTATRHEVVLQNPLTIDVRVLGSSTSCTCAYPEDEGVVVVPANGVAKVPVIVRPKLRQKSFHQQIVFHLDSPSQREVVIDLGGSVY